MSGLPRIQTTSGFDIDTLEVETTGVLYFKGGPGARKRRFAFPDIEHVLLSPTGLLAFQVGEEVISIQTNPDDANDRQAIEALVNALRRSVSWGSFSAWRE